MIINLFSYFNAFFSSQLTRKIKANTDYGQVLHMASDKKKRMPATAVKGVNGNFPSKTKTTLFSNL